MSWTREEIAALKTLSNSIKDPRSPKWKKHLPRKSPEQIARMMKIVEPSGDVEKDIAAAFMRWEEMGYSATRAYRLYMETKRKKA